MNELNYFSTESSSAPQNPNSLSPSQEVGNRMMGVFARVRYNRNLFPEALQ
jgi:hypothetical protein